MTLCGSNVQAVYGAVAFEENHNCSSVSSVEIRWRLELTAFAHQFSYLGLVHKNSSGRAAPGNSPPSVQFQKALAPRSDGIGLIVHDAGVKRPLLEGR